MSSIKKRKQTAAIPLRELVKEMILGHFGGTSSEEDEANLKHLISAQTVFAQKLFSEIANMIDKGERVRVKNFGSFSLRSAPEKARNPKIGMMVHVKNRRRIHFHASTKLIDSLNEE